MNMKPHATRPFGNMGHIFDGVEQAINAVPFISDEEAEREFREYLLKHRKPVAEKEPIRDILNIDIKTGIYTPKK